MKFKNTLSEGVYLKRYYRFLIEIALHDHDKRKRMLYCPNLHPLPACEVLGSRLWFSSSKNVVTFASEQLDKLEIIEVDEGEKVLINPEYASLMVRESVHHGQISELQEYRFLYQHTLPAHNHLELLLKENGEQCFLYIEPIFDADQNGMGSLSQKSFLKTVISELLFQKSQGHQAFLIFAAMHTGLKSLKLEEALSTEDSTLNLLIQAKKLGLEMMAYGIELSLKEANLGPKLSISLSENIISQ